MSMSMRKIAIALAVSGLMTPAFAGIEYTGQVVSIEEAAAAMGTDFTESKYQYWEKVTVTPGEYWFYDHCVVVIDSYNIGTLGFTAGGCWVAAEVLNGANAWQLVNGATYYLPARLEGASPEQLAAAREPFVQAAAAQVQAESDAQPLSDAEIREGFRQWGEMVSNNLSREEFETFRDQLDSRTDQVRSDADITALAKEALAQARVLTESDFNDLFVEGGHIDQRIDGALDDLWSDISLFGGLVALSLLVMILAIAGVVRWLWLLKLKPLQDKVNDPETGLDVAITAADQAHRNASAAMNAVEKLRERLSNLEVSFVGDKFAATDREAIETALKQLHTGEQGRFSLPLKMGGQVTLSFVPMPDTEAGYRLAITGAGPRLTSLDPQKKSGYEVTFEQLAAALVRANADGAFVSVGAEKQVAPAPTEQAVPASARLRFGGRRSGVSKPNPATTGDGSAAPVPTDDPLQRLQRVLEDSRQRVGA